MYAFSFMRFKIREKKKCPQVGESHKYIKIKKGRGYAPEEHRCVKCGNVIYKRKGVTLD